jgi:hypothetical protein
MSIKLRLPDGEMVTPYHEENIRVPLVVTILILVMVAAPLVYWILKINEEGTRSTNVSKYNVLLAAVGTDLKTVDAMVRNDADELAAINAASKKQKVTLIVPEVVIVEDRKEAPKKQQGTLAAELEGIYWSPNNPLAGINGETYRVGDKIQGYEIVRIGKTSVQFQGEDGTIVVLDMYDDLLK